MGAVQPPHGTPRPATTVTLTLRPLAAMLALVLVAALVPGAHAEENDTAADAGLGEPGLLAVTEQAEQLAEAYDAQASLAARTPGSPDAAAGTDGDAGGDVGGEAGSDGSERAGEPGQQPTQEPPVVVAELRSAGQQRDGQPDLAATGTPGAIGQGPGGDQDAAPSGGTGGDDPAVSRGPAQVLAGEEQPKLPVAGAQGQAGRSGESEGEAEQPLGGPRVCESGGCAESLLDPGEPQAEAEDDEDDVLMGATRGGGGGGGRRGRPPRQPSAPGAAAADEPPPVDTRLRQLEQQIEGLREVVEDPHALSKHEAALLRWEADSVEQSFDPLVLHQDLEYTLKNLRFLGRMQLASGDRARLEQVISRAEEALVSIGLPPTGADWAISVATNEELAREGAVGDEIARFERSVNYVVEELQNPQGWRAGIAASYREMAERAEQRPTDPRTAPEVVRRKVDFVLGAIDRMGSQVADNLEQQGKLAELKATAEGLRQRLTNPMSAVDLKDVVGTPGFRLPPSLPEPAGYGGNQPVIPSNLPGFRPPPTLPELAGYASNRLTLPSQTVITATKLDTGPLLQQDTTQTTSRTGQAIATAAPPLTAAAIGLAILSMFSSRPGSPPPAALGSVLPWLGPAVPAGQQG
jgi:hypothetical protein